MFDRLTKLFSARTSATPTATGITAENSVAQDFKNRGNAYFQQGALDAAADCYRQAIAAAPDYAEAHNNLGHVCLALGSDDEAERHLIRAIDLQPELANAHFNLGKLLQKQGLADRALAAYEKTLALSPGNAETLLHLGEAFFSLARIDDALSCLRLAIKLGPDRFLFHYNLGIMLRAKGDAIEAIACFRRTIALAPEFQEAHCEIGSLLRERAEYGAAMLHLERAIALKPDSVRAHHNLGQVQLAQGNMDAAILSFQQAISLDPDFGPTHVCLAEALQKLGRIAEATVSIDRAIAIDPHSSQVHIVKGLVLKDEGRFEEAESSLRHALQLAPDFDAAKFTLSTILLAGQQLTEGWELFAYRFYDASLTQRRVFEAPTWSGDDLRDKTILVWGDQGVGDEILFASLVPDLVAKAKRCILECAPKLTALFAGSFPEAIVVPKMTPPHSATRQADIQIAAADAARWLRPDIASFPPHEGYLKPDPARLSYWKDRLSTLGNGLKVGISWRSTRRDGRRNLHYTSLDQWRPIFEQHGVHFINLQYGECESELAAAQRQLGIPLHAYAEVDLFDDLAEAAALNKALDLVISAPTTTAILSGALGVPTWMMSYAIPWQTHGTAAFPWMPAVRCFPRRWDQSWEEIIRAIAEALQQEVRRHA